MRRAVLLGLALLLVAAAALSARPAERGFAQSPQPQPNADGSYTVPSDWPLLPRDIRPGHSFRLLFITSQLYIPTSTDIATYNSAVQTVAASTGHSAIQPYAHAFRAVGSTAAVDARDNTATTGAGLRIYWLGGNKLADDYADFYDGSWDDYGRKNEQGNRPTYISNIVWTGSNQDGTGYDGEELGASGFIRTGTAEPGSNPLNRNRFNHRDSELVRFAYMALSPVFTVGRHSAPNPDVVTDVPHDWELIPPGLGPGDEFRLLFMTSTRRDATPTSLFFYDSYVQDRAAAGHPAIRPYARLFRVVGSNKITGARDHTGTNPGRDGAGAPIWWLNGPRVAAGNSVFWSGSWDHWTEADRRFESGEVAGDDRPWTGTKDDGTRDNDELGDQFSKVRIGSARYTRFDSPIDDYFDDATASHSFYALSTIFRVSEPPPRLVFSTTHMIADEPPGCADAANDAATFGPILNRDLATYTVRLSSDPGGDASVVVYDPSDSRSIFWQYIPTYQGRITNQPAGDTSPVTNRWNDATLLNFNSSNWNVPQTVKLNIHCAAHDAHEWNLIWHKVRYPGDLTKVIEPRPDRPGELQSRTVDHSRWELTRVRVIDASAPGQPADLTVATAYAGALSAALDGSVYKFCEATGPDDGPRGGLRPGDFCEWGFGVQWSWATADHPNDLFDAQRHFTSFRVTVESGEGDPAWAYSYVPEPTYARSVEPGFVIDHNRSYNSAPYRQRIRPTGLFTTHGAAANPGDPVYRITVTPVTVRGHEVPGEAATLCVQLRSAAGIPANKYPAVVDCATFARAVFVGMMSEGRPAIAPPTALPALTISSDAASVTEGGSVTYTISATPAPREDTTLELNVTEELGDGGDRIGRQQLVTLTIPAGQGSVSWTVTTLADRSGRAGGTAVGEIMHGDGYTLGDPSSVSVTLLDGDAPAPEISISAGGGITEGGTASFTITASPAPASPITVNVGVSESGDFGASGAATVTVSGATTTYTIATSDDSIDEPDGSVTATLRDGGGYTVSASNGAATVAVADDDGPSRYTVSPGVIAAVKALAAQVQHGPDHVNRWNRVLVAFGEHDGAGVTGGATTAAEAQRNTSRYSSPVWHDVVTELTALEAWEASQSTPELSITGGGGVTEGGMASFTISASPAPASPITVNMGVSQSGAFGASGAATVTVSGATTTYTVSTSDDSIDEPDGSVTATLQDGSGYTVSASQGAATVSVADDDDPPTPELSISAGGGITEGGTASFTISASPAPASPITVTVAVSQSGAFGASGAATITVSGATTTYTVSTSDDSADEPDGSVTATLRDGGGYTVSASQGAATVGVSDNDDPPKPPELSISPGDGVTEGGTASFTITASPAPSSPITVTVAVSQSGDFGASGAATVTVSGATTTYTVATSDDSADEPDGSVTATLQDGGGYTVSASNGAATVGVSDNDDPPKPEAALSVSVEDASATEGGYLSFTVRLSQASSEPVVVRWNTATADDPDDRAHRHDDYEDAFDSLLFAPGVTERTARVWLKADGEDEGDEFFAVELFLPGAWFEPDATGVMTIVDGD